MEEFRETEEDEEEEEELESGVVCKGVCGGVDKSEAVASEFESKGE